MKENLVKVLWVENDPEVIDAYPDEAFEYGLELIPFTNWDEAEIELKKGLNKYSAIILDAKCCLHPDSADNAAIFLINVTNAITRMCNGKNFIPWFVLSGQAEDNIKDLIPESRKSWDGDWPKSFYDKNVDREMLYHRILNYAREHKTASMKVHEMYKEVFNAIDDLKLHDDVDNYLSDILIEMHFSELDEKNLNDNYNKVRLCIEYIYRRMIEFGMLPPQEKINLKWSNCILSGKECLKGKIKVAEGLIPIFPKILQDNVIHMIHTAGSALHTEDEEDENTKHLREYLESVGNSSYLIKSYALQICDIILWLNKFIQNNPDKELNSNNWEVWDKSIFH